MTSAISVGFGKAAPGTSYPTICPTGQVSGESGFAIAVAYSPDAFWNANGGDK